jgi:hypothetical protein
MQVTVTVEFDDGTEIKRQVKVDSAGNPLYWGQGFKRGAQAAAEDVQRMAEAQYGTAPREGIHILSAG